MIEKISVTNFKSHAQTDIELGHLTALVGPNGCGKTSFLKAIYCLGESVWRAWDSVFVGEQSPDVLVRKGKNSFGIAATGANVYRQYDNDADNFSWSIAIEMIGIGAWRARTRWEWMGEKSQPTVLNNGQSIKEAAGSVETEIVDSVYFQASLEKLKKPSYPEALPLQIGFDGSGLASVLASLKTADDMRFNKIEDDLRAIVPSIKRIKARRVQMTLYEKKVISVNETRIPYNEPREVVG
ncbi:MAG: AAA family ATPase, partial [Blastocatellia bacterium]